MKLKLFIIILLFTSSAGAEIYRGSWWTTNRPIEGPMNLEVIPDGKDKYLGHFWGVWEGVSWDYSVPFKGPENNLKGVAIIDGAYYEWKGVMNKHGFNGSFTGDRYNGEFKLKKIPKQYVPE